MNNPLVTICVPAYNVEHYLDETIQSILNQTYRNIEVIIVDDGSKDGSLAAAKKYENEHIKIYSQKNSGASAARNKAYSHSNGELIKFLDGDDLMNPEMIESQVKLALENEHCLISSKWGRFYNNDLATFQLRHEECWQTLPVVEWLCSSWKNGDSMTQPGMFLIPRSILSKAGLWNESLSTIDDMEFFTRVILNSEKVIFDPQSTLYYRSGLKSSLSAQISLDATLSAYRSIDESTRNFLAKVTSPATRNACANIWQSFLHEIYPKHLQLSKKVQASIDSLGGSTLKFKCGGFTKLAVTVIGWKATKWIKHYLGKD
jgi:glycosyltransferase involved in cell wall biosynthesis